MKNKFICLLLIICILLLSILCGCKEQEIKIYYGKDKILASTDSEVILSTDFEPKDIKAYVEVVLQEAVELISATDNISSEKARNQILSNKYSIYTNFKKEVFDSVKSAVKTLNTEDLDIGCAVTDVGGKLVAVYSGGNENTNFASTPTPPYSSIKPLSVYTPSIEADYTDWSGLYQDSPIKKVTQSDGTVTDWPTNADGTYTSSDTLVVDAIKHSLNTVAVRCIDEYGITNSIEFLTDAFNFPLDAEKSILESYGEGEILGNLAMGYMREGVSPINMAGYYQIFASEGIYTQPKTISKIVDSKGNTLYSHNSESKQVIKKSTAIIMNLLLQEVLTPEGTGNKAVCDVTAGGKTGTGELGNWFVGFTPEYTCAVWHGTQIQQNQSPMVFSEIIKGIPDKILKDFTITSKVKRKVYCCESGMLKSEDCEKVATGYFASDSLPAVCYLH